MRHMRIVVFFSAVMMPVIAAADSEPPLPGPAAIAPLPLQNSSVTKNGGIDEPPLPPLPGVIDPLAAAPEKGEENEKPAKALETKQAPAAQSAPSASPAPSAALAFPSQAESKPEPAVAYLERNGSVITDLGSSHGLRTISARHGEEFILFVVAPDGEAVVSGVPSEMPVDTLLTLAGKQVTDLGTAHEMRGLFIKNGSGFQVLYATPDGKSVISGLMWDAIGKNLTREQIKDIPGAVPSAVIESGKNEPGNPNAGGPGKRSALDAVQESFAGVAGAVTAPKLWMVVDPMCSYSIQALRQLKPLVEQGKFQIAVVPVSVLDYEDQGKSTSSALALVSQDPEHLVAAWAHGDMNGSPNGEAAGRLQGNMAIAAEIGLKGTPTFIWHKADGSEGRIDGVPNDWNAIVASMEDGHEKR